MVRCLVTGGAGFIGSHIATARVEQQDDVVVFDDFSTGRRGNLAHLENRITVIQGDLLDRDALAQALDGVEIVYHQAALASVPRSVAAPIGLMPPVTPGP